MCFSRTYIPAFKEEINRNRHSRNTLSDNGAVTRGICRMDENAFLTGVDETSGIEKTADGGAAAVKALVLTCSQFPDVTEVKLQVEAEAYAKESGKKIAFIDGYRNGKMVEKLGIAELPAIIEMKKGTMARSAKPASIDDVKNFVA